MPITDWPAEERPREKLLARGPAALSDAELLAIFLRTGVPGKTALDLARELLTEYGGLRGLLAANETEFCAFPGMGTAKFAQLQATLEMSRRHLGEQFSRGEALTSPEQTRAWLTARLRDRQQEVFCVLFLDNRNRVLAFEEMFQGTLNGASVYPREILRRVLAHNAGAVILVHNHPSGVAEPSRADEGLTRRLVEVLNHVDVRVLDHFIVGDGEIVSFAERGLL